MGSVIIAFLKQCFRCTDHGRWKVHRIVGLLDLLGNDPVYDVLAVPTHQKIQVVERGRGHVFTVQQALIWKPSERKVPSGNLGNLVGVFQVSEL